MAHYEYVKRDTVVVRVEVRLFFIYLRFILYLSNYYWMLIVLLRVLFFIKGL